MVPHSEDVRRYLMQTQELFGEELYLNLQIQHPDSSGEFGADFNSFEQEICNCKNCPLSRSRTKFVFGVGDPNASLLLVGGEFHGALVECEDVECYVGCPEDINGNGSVDVLDIIELISDRKSVV